MSNELRKQLPKEMVSALEELKKQSEGPLPETESLARDHCVLPVWFDGKHINEILFYEYLLSEQEVKCIHNKFYCIDREISDNEMDNIIMNVIKSQCTAYLSSTVERLRKAMKIYCFSDPFPLHEDRIHFRNGTYYLDGRFEKRKEWTRNRLFVDYNPDAPEPVHWKKFLGELLHEEEILSLQEFMGYCMIPCNRGQCMLMIIGRGGEGKSRIGRVLRAIFGHNMNTGSIQKLENDRFARADQDGKLLYMDDDLKTEALPSTNMLKAIVTLEDEIDLEKKGKQSFQGKLYCRLLAFGNGTLKSLYDRSDGFYRRQLILTTKDKDPNRVDDPYLGDKLRSEAEAIALWCIEGLKRLIANDFRFTVSERSKVLMEELKEDDDSVLSFLKSKGYVGFEENSYASSSKLYRAYLKWCEENLEAPVTGRNFSRRMKERSEQFGFRYDKNLPGDHSKTQRGFRGINVKIRTDDYSFGRGS